MRPWKVYKEYHSTGEWHVHTSYTDGRNTVEEYCREFIKYKIPLVVFSEHVRRKMNYNYNSLLSDIETARMKYPEIIILPGAEAKLLPDGTIDAPDCVLEVSEHTILSVHRFPDDNELYIWALKRAILSGRADCWGHPGLYFKKRGLHFPEEFIPDIISALKRSGMAVEFNRKYNLPEKHLLEAFIENDIPILRGSDIHSVDEIPSISSSESSLS